MTVPRRLVVKIVHGIHALERTIDTAQGLFFNLDADISEGIELLEVAGPVPEIENVADAIAGLRNAVAVLHAKLGDIASENGVEVPIPPRDGGPIIEGCPCK